MNIVPTTVTEDMVELALDANHEHLLNQERSEALAAAVRSELGADVKLKIVVGQSDAETPAEIRERRETERQQAAHRAIENDPNVQEIINRFDATIIPDSIQTRDS